MDKKLTQKFDPYEINKCTLQYKLFNKTQTYLITAQPSCQ